MGNEPALVTVLLPVKGIDSYFNEALTSILNQSMRNFKVLLIADKNLDFSKYEKLDPRVNHLKVDVNLNLSQKLNAGINVADTKYLARMDADDISHHGRFSAQIKFLEENSEVDLLGTAIKFIGSLPNHRNTLGEVALLPKSNKELLIHMLNKNPFFHPTVMIRTEKLNKFRLRYNEKFLRSQDYELWTQAAGKLVFANLQEPLLDYRLHDAQSGVLGSIDSKYFSNLAKLKYCWKAIFAFKSWSMGALHILPFRLREFIISMIDRRMQNFNVAIRTST